LAFIWFTKFKINELKAAEKEMSIKDEHEQKIDDAKNELETYIFRMYNGLTRDFPQYFDPTKKETFLKKVNEIQNWFNENEFDRLTLQEYENKLGALKEFGDEAIARKESREKLPVVIKKFEEQAEELIKRLNTKNSKFEHITKEERFPAKKAVEKFKNWLFKKQQTHLEISFKKFEAEHKIADLTSQINKIMSKAKPPPPPKSEEQKQEGKVSNEKNQTKVENNSNSSKQEENKLKQNPENIA
jgi:heat shock protein 4